LANEAEDRALIRDIFVSSTDLDPDDATGTLSIRIHRMVSPVYDGAVARILAALPNAGFRHPETGHCFICQLV